jgi:hypothetical protein
MRVGVQRQQTLLVTTELVIWRYANAFIFTNQSELDFGIALVEITNSMHRFAELLYSVYWLLHVSAIACHHQGASGSILSYII